MKYKYLIHNLIGHPLMGILELFGFNTLAERVHDMTLPAETTK